MSNRTLVESMQKAIADYRSDLLSAEAAVLKLSAGFSALEALPYALVTELGSLVLDLEHAAANEKDGFQSDRAVILGNMEIALKKVPVSV